MAEDLMAKDGCIDYNMSRDEGGTERDGIEKFQSIVFIQLGKLEVWVGVDLGLDDKVVVDTLGWIASSNRVWKDTKDRSRHCKIVGYQIRREKSLEGWCFQAKVLDHPISGSEIPQMNRSV